MLHAILTALLSLSPAAAFTQGDPPASTSAESKPTAKLYDVDADAKQQIAEALAKAKAEVPNKRVLIQWGGNWCGWCIKLHGLYKSNAAIKKELNYEYVVVFVDAGQPKGKNIEFAKTYGADLQKEGFPFLTVLAADGAVIANQESASLETKSTDGKSAGLESGHDAKAVLAFLKAHETPHPTAQSLLDAGVALAKSSGKTVFVHFGAPWCGWCHRLEDWMAQPAIAAILAKDFVDVKIDTDRTQGGQALLDTMSNKQSGGIPWIVFLAADGKPLINSNGPDGNTGFPAAPDEIAHFQSMLTKARKNMTEQEVQTLIADLKAQSK